MNAKKIIAAMLLALIFVGCKKESTTTPAPTTSLKIAVATTSGTPTVGATVTLYYSSTDFLSQANALSSKLTGADGTVSFTGLSSHKYYFFASKDCFTNSPNNVSSAGSIIENTTTTISTTIESSGKLVFNNTSVNPYRIYINGVSAFDMNGNTTTNLPYVRSGAYSIRVLQLSGFLLTPTDITYTGNLACGGTLTTTFP